MKKRERKARREAIGLSIKKYYEEKVNSGKISKNKKRKSKWECKNIQEFHEKAK
jgi:hypothetical protein